MLAGQLTPVTALNTRFFGHHAKDRAQAIVMALVTHPKAVPWKIEVKFYVLTGL